VGVVSIRIPKPAVQDAGDERNILARRQRCIVLTSLLTILNIACGVRFLCPLGALSKVRSRHRRTCRGRIRMGWENMALRCHVVIADNLIAAPKVVRINDV
jgi:hypothetical protein